MVIIVKTMSGLEEILANELQELGLNDVEIHNRSVSCVGTEKQLYEINYYCRTALRVLKQIKHFECHNKYDLYDGMKSIDWSKYITNEGSFAIDSTSNQSAFDNTMFISVQAKDAIADQFREKTGKRPNVEREFPDVRINIHVFRDECNVCLDSSADSLHKRGYRVDIGEAPIKEVLAAGLVLLSGWDKKSLLIDGMCGSGTIAIEAAMIARNVPAGYFRREFGFERWIDFKRELWEEIILHKEKNIKKECPVIIGIEKSRKVVQAAYENVKESQMRDYVKIYNEDFFEYTPPESPGMVILNPPYGERLENEDETELFELYKSIGTTFKHKYGGYTGWIITSNMEASKHVGLRPSRKIKLFNGALESKFFKYEMYSGSKKAKKNGGENTIKTN